MEAMWDWGLDIIRIFQTIESPVLTNIVKAVSFLGSAPAYIILLCVIFWAFDQKIGFRLGIILLFSASVNNSLKSFLQVPRPYTRDPSVGLAVESSSSTPSGHSQNSAAFWPTFSFLHPKMKKLVSILIAVLIPVLIGLTRIYLGVHYPTDVLFGWAIGFSIALFSMFFSVYIIKFISSLPKMFKVLLAALVTFLFNMLSPADTSMQAALFGFALGYVFLIDKNFFDAKSGSLLEKVIRTMIGLCVIGALYIGLKQIFPGETSNYYQLFRFTRFALVGFFASFVLPRLFVIMKLAKPLQE